VLGLTGFRVCSSGFDHAVSRCSGAVVAAGERGSTSRPISPEQGLRPTRHRYSGRCRAILLNPRTSIPCGRSIRMVRTRGRFSTETISRWLPDGSDILTRVARTSYLYDLANTRHRQISTQPNAESMPILNWVTGASRSLARDEVDEDLRSIGCAAAEANV